MLRKIGSRFSLVDLFHLVYLSFLLLLVFRAPVKNGYFFASALLYLLLLVSLFFLVHLRQKIKSQPLYFTIYFCYPVIYLLIIFQSLNWLLPALSTPAFLQNHYDPLLYAIDSYLVNVHPVIWFEQRAHPLITDLMYLIYSYYFFMPLILLILLFVHRKYQELQISYFILTLSFYLSYIGYILIPARGPRFYLALTPVEGLFFSDILRDLINLLEPNKYDAFPSVHQLISVLILLISFRYERKFFYFSLPIVVGITISLFYCQYHYIVDVIAGTVLAIIFFIFGNKITEKSNGTFRDQLILKSPQFAD
jgi:membrane-associated phospholipid phosphatase